MDVFEAISTTCAMPRRDLARPVSGAILRTIVKAATKTPDGSNQQPVRWLVVRDDAMRRKLGEVCRRSSWFRAPQATMGRSE